MVMTLFRYLPMRSATLRKAFILCQDFYSLEILTYSLCYIGNINSFQTARIVKHEMRESIVVMK